MKADTLDIAEPVRSGEELDVPKLSGYLRDKLPDFEEPLELLQFRKGYSNLTYLLRSGGREYVLRRPPFGAQIKSAHDMGREYRILSRLRPVYARVPEPFTCCEDAGVIGAPFYVMERVPGIILRSSLPEGVDFTPSRFQTLSRSFIATLAEVHGLDFKSAGLGDLGKPDGYVSRQIEGWIKRYLNARTDDIPEMEKLGAWLAGNRPPESGAALIHNDFKYDNLILDAANPTEIRAILDWEMATLGDPIMDLGSTLGYWADPDDPEEWQQQAFGVTTRPGNWNRMELWESYSELKSRSARGAVFYYAYGVFKIAVIVQQIYARYKAGFTKDERFARLIDMVRAASRIGMLAIDKKRISNLG